MSANAKHPLFLPKGFKFSAVTAGIKVSGKPDLALIFTGPQNRAAALFTKTMSSRRRFRSGVLHLRAAGAECAPW